MKVSDACWADFCGDERHGLGVNFLHVGAPFSQHQDSSSPVCASDTFVKTWVVVVGKVTLGSRVLFQQPISSLYNNIVTIA